MGQTQEVQTSFLTQQLQEKLSINRELGERSLVNKIKTIFEL